MYRPFELSVDFTDLKNANDVIYRIRKVFQTFPKLSEKKYQKMVEKNTENPDWASLKTDLSNITFTKIIYDALYVKFLLPVNVILYLDNYHLLPPDIANILNDIWLNSTKTRENVDFNAVNFWVKIRS
ncbi:MAG TPA: hypothetical protein PLQ36_02095 [Candidatus Gracilibacteria bacterium]|nr:hypothetical protein [Candidatus Gracilibacteria bacterium]